MSDLEAIALDDARRRARGEVKADDFAIYGSPAPVILAINGLYVRKRVATDKGGQYRVADRDNVQMGWIAFQNGDSSSRFNGVTPDILLAIVQDHIRDLNVNEPCAEYEAVMMGVELALVNLAERSKRILLEGR